MQDGRPWLSSRSFDQFEEPELVLSRDMPAEPRICRRRLFLPELLEPAGLHSPSCLQYVEIHIYWPRMFCIMHSSKTPPSPCCLERPPSPPQMAVPPELAIVGFSEKLVYLPHSYQVNSYNISLGFCQADEALRHCQASARRARAGGFIVKNQFDKLCLGGGHRELFLFAELSSSGITHAVSTHAEPCENLYLVWGCAIWCLRRKCTS